MYLVGRIFEKKDNNAMMIELPSECVGVMPVYKDKASAQKYSLDKFPIYQMAAKTTPQQSNKE